MIYRLQQHNFQWEDEPFDVLIKKYPNCKSALLWWCNAHDKIFENGKSRFNIAKNKWLKEFILNNPPTFKISAKCCDNSKKNLAKKIKQNNNIQLSISGIRRAEGGVRATAYKNCFTCYSNGCDEFRPIFYYKNEDKKCYEKNFNITHSDCYTKYGLSRTGCAGCPFEKNFEFELKVIQEHEPQLFKAVNNIFKNSYEYTRKYREFYNSKK